MTRRLTALDIVIIIALIIVAAIVISILFIDGINLEAHGHSAITHKRRQLGQLLR